MALGINSFYTKKTLMNENIKVRNIVEIESMYNLIAILNLSKTEEWLKFISRFFNGVSVFKSCFVNDARFMKFENNFYCSFQITVYKLRHL